MYVNHYRQIISSLTFKLMVKLISKLLVLGPGNILFPSHEEGRRRTGSEARKRTGSGLLSAIMEGSNIPTSQVSLKLAGSL